MINLTIALMAEAAPVIKHWKLQKSSQQSPFPIYEGDGVTLIISGKGKCNSAAATSWLASTTNNPGPTPSVWINIGIAGHRSFDTGTVINASKLLENSTGHCWYPTLIKNKIKQTTTVCTVDTPCSDYPDTHTYDMEATGFYQTAIRFTTAELTQCIKVISDNLKKPIEKINAGLAGELISAAMPAIDEQCQTLRSLTDSVDTVDTADVEAQFHRQYRFSVTQKHMLRRLLVRHVAVFGHLNINTEKLHHTAGGKTPQLLRTLDAMIRQTSS